MPTAADILEHAKELTERYAKSLRAKDCEIYAVPAASDCDIYVAPPVPGRVFVLMQNATVLGVLTEEQKALDEAHSWMHASGKGWQETIQNRHWHWSPVGSGVSLSISISVHDVR